MKKNILKKIVQSALKCEFGFAPALKDIVLLEANNTRTYIMFKVKDKFYHFRSHQVGKNGELGVWVAEGTITRVDEEGFLVPLGS